MSSSNGYDNVGNLGGDPVVVPGIGAPSGYNADPGTPNVQVAVAIGPASNPAITKPYTKQQVERRYRDAIEDGISEDDLIHDLRWMLDTARQQEDVSSVLRVYRFIMEYTVGKPDKSTKGSADINVTILQALERGAEFMVGLTPDADEGGAHGTDSEGLAPKGIDDLPGKSGELADGPYSEPGTVPGATGTPGDDTDPRAADDS